MHNVHVTHIKIRLSCNQVPPLLVSKDLSFKQNSLLLNKRLSLVKCFQKFSLKLMIGHIVQYEHVTLKTCNLRIE